MNGFVPVGKVSDLLPGQMKWVAVNRERVLLVNVDGMFYALKDECGHQRAPLSKGTLAGHVVGVWFSCWTFPAESRTRGCGTSA